MNSKTLRNLFIIFSSIFACVLIVGIVFLSVFGFNSSIDLVGGEKVTISVTNAGLQDEKVYKEQFVAKQGEIISKVNKALLKFGKANITSEILGEGQDQTIIIKYKDLAKLSAEEISAQNAEIIDEIKTSIAGVSTLDLTVSDATKISSSTWVNWGIESIALCVLILLIFTYFMIRFFTQGAISVLLGMVISSFSFLGIIAFSRIEVTKYLGCAIAICVVLTAILQVLILNKIKKLYVNNKNEESPFIWQAVKETLFESLLLCGVLCVLGVGFSFFNLTLGLYLIISAVCVCLINLFIVPGFLQIFTGKKGLKLRFNKINK